MYKLYYSKKNGYFDKPSVHDSIKTCHNVVIYLFFVPGICHTITDYIIIFMNFH